MVTQRAGHGIARVGKAGIMKVALINPNWQFDGSIYFGCREPHLPLEYGYARALLEQRGHRTLLIDAQMDHLGIESVRTQLRQFGPDVTVVTTAPSYLFWRCAPPELRVPKKLLLDIQGLTGTTVAIGPHISTTPKAALTKLDSDAGIIGEPEEILPILVETPREQWHDVPSICYRRD